MAACATFGAMVAVPLNPTGGRCRRALSNLVVVGLATTTLASTTKRWGSRRAVVAAGVVGLGTTIVERVGTATGRPFGQYEYTAALRPQLAGVPAAVPLAWFAMAVPARETAHAALGAHSSPATRIVGGAVALTAWDLFLDPQMVGEGYWRWARRGLYRCIPVSNFVGWFVTSLGVMTVLEALLPAGEPDGHLVAEYAGMAAMETLGFVAFFGDRLVAAVGGAAMLPLAAVAVGRLVGQRS